MRIAAILYIIASVTANFFIGTLTTFVLAAISFPLLLGLLLKKRPGTKSKAPLRQQADSEANLPGAV